MKTAMSLEAMAAEISRQQREKHDFKAPTSKMTLIASSANGGVDFDLDTVGVFEPTPLFHDQVGQHTGIPSKYYDRMLDESPELLARNVNHWLHSEKETRLIRTLGGTARAFLSNRYRTIDNADVAEAVLPIILDGGSKLGLRVESCTVTDRQLYIKAVSERVEGKILGEQVQSGIVISNSEVGLHSFKVEPLVFVLSCLNGAIMNDAGMRRYHIGRQAAELESAMEVFTDETRKADDRVLMMKMADVVRASFDQVAFAETIKTLSINGRKAIRKELPAVAESIIEVFSLPDKWQGGILEQLAQHPRNVWGVSNALTRFAQDPALSYEEATDLERLGGSVLTLADSKWEEVAA
jgi:hypothetical protein